MVILINAMLAGNQENGIKKNKNFLKSDIAKRIKKN
jgi:hypothetical protein